MLPKQWESKLPYIKQEDRPQYDEAVENLVKVLDQNGWVDGHFNYVVSAIIKKWFESNKRYTTANSIMGVVDCIGKEFYRRHIAPYEDEKIEENGDV